MDSLTLWPRDGHLLDLSEGTHVPAAELAGRLLAELERNAEALGAGQYLARVGEIVAGGTGCKRQLATAAAVGEDLTELVRRSIVIGG